ncbi:ligand-binding sensor domain-containing protein [Cyclonatronum proteinivorum]|uniref:Ligand-binding sensor domain-containing protein n=1 Tax=Cyclonatronum proteinivorum TaxID=1457365 RepID=A0A345UJR0_9BACT|nr:hypothetical protein [Cyclonatronum proteinivorum]AXJ00712.1 ligand-binding sensor domain-containing protein [Cyclonatronum proteinivorum]
MHPGILLLLLLFQFSPTDPEAPYEHIVRQYTINDGLPLNAVQQIVQGRDGFLYMATYDGLVRFDGYAFKVFNRINTYGLSTNRLLSLGFDEHGKLWLASPYGNLSAFDGVSFTNHDQTDLRELPFLEGFDDIANQVGRLGSALGGAIPFLTNHELADGTPIRIDSTAVTINNQIVLGNQELRGGFEDEEGTVWVYTRNNGLFQIRESRVRNFSDRNGISFENTYSVFEPNPQELWIKGFMNFAIRYDGNTGTINNFNIINGENRSFQYMFADPLDGSVYAYSEAVGLRKFTDGEWPEISWFSSLFGRAEPERPGIHATHRTQNGDLFIGTAHGLIVDQNGTSEWVKDKTGHNFRWVRTIRETEDGLLWMGTNGFGIYQLNPADWSWRQFTTANGLSSDFIRDIHFSHPDTLWLATQDRGLNRIILDDDGFISDSAQILPANGLLNHGLHRIIADAYGYLWVNSNGGIMLFEEENLNAYASGLTRQLLTRIIHN